MKVNNVEIQMISYKILLQGCLSDSPIVYCGGGKNLNYNYVQTNSDQFESADVSVWAHPH